MISLHANVLYGNVFLAKDRILFFFNSCRSVLALHSSSFVWIDRLEVRKFEEWGRKGLVGLWEIKRFKICMNAEKGGRRTTIMTRKVSVYVRRKRVPNSPEMEDRI